MIFGVPFGRVFSLLSRGARRSHADAILHQHAAEALCHQHQRQHGGKQPLDRLLHGMDPPSSRSDVQRTQHFGCRLTPHPMRSACPCCSARLRRKAYNLHALHVNCYYFVSLPCRPELRGLSDPAPIIRSTGHEKAPTGQRAPCGNLISTFLVYPKEKAANEATAKPMRFYHTCPPAPTWKHGQANEARIVFSRSAAIKGEHVDLFLPSKTSGLLCLLRTASSSRCYAINSQRRPVVDDVEGVNEVLLLRVGAEE